MKAIFDRYEDSTKEGLICIRIVSETEFEKEFIKRHTWEKYMNDCPIVTTKVILPNKDRVLDRDELYRIIKNCLVDRCGDGIFKPSQYVSGLVDEIIKAQQDDEGLND